VAEYLYDVALSFAGEERAYVGQVAEHLRAASTCSSTRIRP
jgi:hypothetical protein